MAKERLQCQEHGGYFNREATRGQKPKTCGGKNELCNKASQTDSEKWSEAQDSVRAEKPQQSPVRKAQSRSSSNASLDKGKAAKELLEAQGWTATGKAWQAVAPGDPTDVTVGWASVTAARGEETLHIVWMNGEVQDQVYNLWNLDVPSKNGRPNAHLPFDPEEIPDRELAKFLVGLKVTWWNRLAQKEESAVCGRDSIEIEHKWTGTGDEYPSARLIKFIDAEGGGYRHFRLEQLIKIGVR